MLTYFLPIALAVIVLVLLAGLWNMMKGGSTSLSQKLMRLRVGLQLLVVFVLIVSVYFTMA